MNMNPLISIIVPVYNVEPYIRKCLDSILSQTYTNWEAILVDDGSTDGSGAICDEYAKKDSRFVVVHKQNEGVAKARITAFEHSRGQLITFIDADDYVDNCYVSYLYENMINHEVDVSCCQYYRVDKQITKVSKRKNFGYFDKNRIKNVLSTDFLWDRKLKKSSIPMILWSKMIKREYVRSVLEAGYGLWYGEDMVGVLWLMYNIQSMYNSEKPLYYYVFHEGQTIKRMDRKRWDANIAVWNKMLSIDTNGFLKSQAPDRMYVYLKKYIDECFEKAESYKDFKEEASYALNSTILKEILFSTDMSYLSTKEKIKFLLMKRKSILVYYVIRKVLN